MTVSWIGLVDCAFGDTAQCAPSFPNDGRIRLVAKLEFDGADLR